MKIQLSLTNEQERDIKSDDRDIADKKEGTKKTEFSSVPLYQSTQTNKIII